MDRARCSCTHMLLTTAWDVAQRPCRVEELIIKTQQQSVQRAHFALCSNRAETAVASCLPRTSRSMPGVNLAWGVCRTPVRSTCVERCCTGKSMAAPLAELRSPLQDRSNQDVGSVLSPSRGTAIDQRGCAKWQRVSFESQVSSSSSSDDVADARCSMSAVSRCLSKLRAAHLENSKLQLRVARAEVCLHFPSCPYLCCCMQQPFSCVHGHQPVHK